MLGRLAPRFFGRRPFSKYISETYGNKQHRLARKPGIEVEPTEVIIYFFGAAILASDVSLEHHKFFFEILPFFTFFKIIFYFYLKTFLDLSRSALPPGNL